MLFRNNAKIIAIKITNLPTKCEISACEEAIEGTDEGCEELGWGCPDAANLHKQFHTSVIQKYRADDRKGIFCQLRQRGDVCSAESYIAIEPKACEEGDWENHA